MEGEAEVVPVAKKQPRGFPKKDDRKKSKAELARSKLGSPPQIITRQIYESTVEIIFSSKPW